MSSQNKPPFKATGPKVLVFTWLSQIFPSGLFVYLNWSEAFRLSSTLSQDRAEREADWLDHSLIFSNQNQTLAEKMWAASPCAESNGTQVRVCEHCCTLFVSHHVPSAPYINSFLLILVLSSYSDSGNHCRQVRVSCQIHVLVI